MRAIPTITLYDAAGTAGKVTMAAGNNIAGTASDIGFSGFRAFGQNGAAGTVRQLYYQYQASAEL